MTIYTAIDRTPFTYLLYCKPTNQYYYGSRYGKGCLPEQIWTTYFTSSKHIKKLIEEYGIESFTYEVRKTFNTIDKCRSWENRFLNKVSAAKSDIWINKHNGAKNFYNIHGHTHTKETKLKLSIINKNKKLSEETKRKIGEFHKNKITSDTTKQKMSDSSVGMLGKFHSTETKQKMSDSRKGRIFSDEWRHKLSESHKGIPKPQQVVTCPHCGKEGSLNNMNRWHFDNCKFQSTPPE